MNEELKKMLRELSPAELRELKLEISRINAADNFELKPAYEKVYEHLATVEEKSTTCRHICMTLNQ